MKQILLVILVLAALMVGFFVQRKLTEPVRRTPPTPVDTPRGTGGPSGTGAQPLAAPDGGAQQPNKPNKRRPSDKTVFVEWKGLASQSSVVPWEDVWSIDLSKVDFAAPVLLTIGDLSITQAELRRMVCLDVGRYFHLARFSEAIAKAQAMRRGSRFELSKLLYEELLAHQATQEGVSIEEKKALLVQQVQLPGELSLEVHRLINASVIYNTLGGEIEDLPAGLVSALRFVGPKDTEGQLALGDNKVPQVFSTVLELREAWNRLHSAVQYEDRALDLTKVSSLTKVFSALQQGMRNKELAMRAWTFLDAPMPDGVFMRVALADIDAEAAPIAPWLLGGDVEDIRVDEIWSAIAGGLSRSALESSLRSVVWYQYLAHRLDQLSALESSAESFARFIKFSNDRADSMLDANFTSQAEGFPTIHHYRAAQRLLEGHRNTLPVGWNEEHVQRPFYEANKFFVERWNPQIEFAYFPALDWNELDGQVWKLDWDKALSEARSIKGKVALGQDFAELAKAHAKELVSRMGRYGGEEFAEEYRKRVFGAATMGTLRNVEESLGETDYVELLRGTSLVKVLAAYQDVGVVSDPLRIEGGYAVVRLSRAELAALSREWQDSTVLCETYYLRSQFLLWSNAELATAAKSY